MPGNGKQMLGGSQGGRKMTINQETGDERAFFGDLVAGEVESVSDGGQTSVCHCVQI